MDAIQRRVFRVFLVALICCATVPIALTKELLLPPYFFFDAQDLASMLRESELVPGDSYQSTAYLYKLLGVDLQSSLWPFLSAVVVGLYFGWKLYAVDKLRVSPPRILLWVACIVISSIYLTTLSKDFFILLLAMFFEVCRRTNLKLAVWSALGLLYAYYFRNYWVITVSLFWLIMIARRLKVGQFGLVLILISALLALSVLTQATLGVDLDHFRFLVNDARAGEENARTTIGKFIDGSSGSIGLSAVNVLLVLASFFLPVPLLLLGQAYYLVIAALFVLLLWSLLRAARLRWDERAADVTGLALIAAFLCTQSVFEPDYGSFLRHLSPFFPLLLGELAARNLKART